MALHKSSDYPKDAYVGPCWLVCDDSEKVRLIAHRCALADAEEYGDCLTCPHGHYDLREGWRIGSAPDGLTNIVRHAEYEEWPRGRLPDYRYPIPEAEPYGDLLSSRASKGHGSKGVVIPAPSAAL
jgi:hypothetical protein